MGEACHIFQIFAVDGVLELKLRVGYLVRLHLDGHALVGVEVDARVDLAEGAAADVLNELELAGDFRGGREVTVGGGSDSVILGSRMRHLRTEEKLQL